MPTRSLLHPGYTKPAPWLTCPTLPTRPPPLHTCWVVQEGERPTNLLCLCYSNTSPDYMPCPTCTPSPFATGGTVPRPVPSTRLCKPHPLVYAPAPHACPPTVPSAWTTPWPPPLVYAPCPTHTPSSFAHILGVQEDRGNVCKGEGHMQGKRAHRTRDGATHTITMVPLHVCKGHASKAGHHPGGEPHVNRRVGTPKQGCERVMVCPHMHARGRVCEWGSVQPGWGWQANGRVGAPKWGCKKEPATGDSVPLHVCKGRGCVSRVACEWKGACPFCTPVPSRST